MFHIGYLGRMQMGGQSSSPTPSSPDPPPIPKLSNENDYPGRRSSWMGGRRSSVGTEYGERSMSLEASEGQDSPVNPAFMFQGGGGGGSSDTEQDGTEMDMDVTQAMNQDIRRKRSMSIARRSSIAMGKALVPLKDENEASMEEDQSADVTTSSMEASQDSEAHMEYTIPLEQSVTRNPSLRAMHGCNWRRSQSQIIPLLMTKVKRTWSLPTQSLASQRREPRWICHLEKAARVSALTKVIWLITVTTWAIAL